jgi:hypothetical protein
MHHNASFGIPFAPHLFRLAKPTLPILSSDSYDIAVVGARDSDSLIARNLCAEMDLANLKKEGQPLGVIRMASKLSEFMHERSISQKLPILPVNFLIVDRESLDVISIDACGNQFHCRAGCIGCGARRVIDWLSTRGVYISSLQRLELQREKDNNCTAR